MAFEKRTWLARIGTGLNKFIIGEKDANDKQTLVNSPDSVTQQGDVISAENLNDLEERIADGFDDTETSLTAMVNENIAQVRSEIEGVPNYATSTFNTVFDSASYGVNYQTVYSVLLPVSLQGYTIAGVLDWYLIPQLPGTTYPVTSPLIPVGVDISGNNVRFRFYVTGSVTCELVAHCVVLFKKSN